MKSISLAVGIALATAPVSLANAQLLNHKDLSLATALTIATTAADTCKGQGYRVSVSVIGRTGEPLVQLRGDDATPLISAAARPLHRGPSGWPPARS